MSIISDPLESFDHHNHGDEKRNKKCIVAGIVALLLGGAGAAVYMTIFKKSSSSNDVSNSSNSGNNYHSINSSPFGANNEDGYSRGFMLPPNADEVLANLYPYSPAEALVAELPASVDWRTNSNVVGPVRSQGGCGSCWAFTAVDNMAMAYGMRYGKQIQLSPQQLIDCDLKQGGCGGGWPTTAWTKYYQVNNHAWGLMESQYPYYFSNPAGKSHGTCTANEALGPIMVTGSMNVQFSQTWSQAAEDNVMAYISQNGPATIAINADGWGAYKGGIATTQSLGCSQSVNHATMIVGFGTENGQNYWIVRNQWGTAWGEGGYIRLARGSNTCCILCYVMAVQVQTTVVTPPPPVVNLGSTLNNGMSMYVGQQLTSTDGTRVLKMQTDGNIVLYKNGASVWSTNTKGVMSGFKMQNDCNLILYDASNVKLWSTNSGIMATSCVSSYLTLQNDGNLIVYNSNAILWASNTNDQPDTVPTTTPGTNTPVTTSTPTTPKPASKISLAAIGCWADSVTQRALPAKLSVSSNSQLMDCVWLAYKAGYKYFGLTFGGECWGGDGSTYNMYGQSSSCNMPCVGNPTETCGGQWAITTYQILITSSSNPNVPTDIIDPSDNNVFELTQPAAALDIPNQCKYYKGHPSFCWKCIDNVHNKIACQDVTSTSTVPDSKNLFVANNLCPDLSTANLTAKEICSAN
jgi:C1A family cysteine protease